MRSNARVLPINEYLCMATPLHSFLDVSKVLAVKPLLFWSPDVQKKHLQSVAMAIQKLKGILEKKEMKDTHAYKALLYIEKNCSLTRLNEVPFIQGLSALVDIYTHGLADEKTKKLIGELEKETTRAKKRILEYHLMLEALEKKSAKFSEEQKLKADLKTLQEVGIFYILEYTLQVLALWPRLNEKGKKGILHDGLSVKEGNLPAYLPLEDSFRKDLCLKIYDRELRTTLLHAFYDFEEVLFSEDLLKIGAALKTFNLALLEAFEKKGLTQFKALIYKPFGNNIPMSEVKSAIMTK